MAIQAGLGEEGPDRLGSVEVSREFNLRIDGVVDAIGPPELNSDQRHYRED